VRVVGADGEMLGVMSVAAGVAEAEEYGLDLVEVSPHAKPPVCKILDYGKCVKLKAARKFLTNEDKVKVTLRFRGREMAHKDIAAKLLVRIKDDLADLSKVEFHPKMEGRQMIMILAPDKTAVEKEIQRQEAKEQQEAQEAEAAKAEDKEESKEA